MVRKEEKGHLINEAAKKFINSRYLVDNRHVSQNFCTVLKFCQLSALAIYSTTTSVTPRRSRNKNSQNASTNSLRGCADKDPCS